MNVHVDFYQINFFQNQIDSRRRIRHKKEKEERKIERRVKAEENRMLGRRPDMKMSLHSDMHFPTFAEETIPNIATSPEFEIDLNVSISPSSFESDSSVPSFAQMIREQSSKEKKNLPIWPSLNGGISGSNTSNSCVWNTTGTRSRTKTECSEDDLEDSASAPEYKQTFSDAFAKALDAAAYKKAQEKNEPSTEVKGKKKKRQKGIVLLSSGGI